MINQHYNGAIQPIEFIQSILKDNKNVTAFEGAMIKDIVKYVGRYGKKDEKIKEAGKILDYALWLFLDVQGIKVDPRLHTHEAILAKVVKINDYRNF